MGSTNYWKRCTAKIIYSKRNGAKCGTVSFDNRPRFGRSGLMSFSLVYNNWLLSHDIFYENLKAQ